ncbi:SDR family NAD(P)-dependent oxidoreductase [Streptomyces sp. NPDC002076]
MTGVTRDEEAVARLETGAVDGMVIGGATVWAVAALFLSVVPSYAGGLLYSRNLALLGTVVAVMLAASCAGQLASRHGLRPRTAQILGLVLLAAGLAALALAFAAHSLPLVLAGAVLAGLGHGLGFLGAQTDVNDLAPGERRGEVTAAYYTCIYLGVGGSVVGVGLVTEAAALSTAVFIVSAVIGIVADEIGRTYGRLDVLVNNAGVMVEVSAARLTAAEIRSVCEVNMPGAATMVHEMLPLLRSSAHPRIVNVSSTTASLSLTAAGTDFGGDAAHRIAYSVSKTALNMLTLQYARAFAADPDLAHIKINAVTPGYVATGMSKGRGTRTVDEGAAVVVAFANLADDGPTGQFHNDRGPVPW